MARTQGKNTGSLKASSGMGAAIKSILSTLFIWALAIVFLAHLYVFVLIFLPVPRTILMQARAAQGQTIDKTWVPLSKISKNMVAAVIAAEDANFCEHSGLDFEAIDKALEERKTGRIRGASTITQQTAKNVFLWNGGGWVRKAAEAWFTLIIEKVWGKSRVMEVYLNVAEWGDGIFGVEAAAQARFNTSADKLSPRQAALLAAVLPNPNEWRLDPPGRYVLERARTLKSRMQVVRGEKLDACVYKSLETKAEAG